MKLIEPKAVLLLQPEGLEGVYKQIELCGRTCYKSTDKITDESAKPFVERMIASKHTAMLEQGTVYLKFFGASESLRHLYTHNPYSRVRTNGETIDGNYIVVYYVTTNLRVLVENDLLEHLKYVCVNPPSTMRRGTLSSSLLIEVYHMSLSGIEYSPLHRKAQGTATILRTSLVVRFPILCQVGFLRPICSSRRHLCRL